MERVFSLNIQGLRVFYWARLIFLGPIFFSFKKYIVAKIRIFPPSTYRPAATKNIRFRIFSVSSDVCKDTQELSPVPIGRMFSYPNSAQLLRTIPTALLLPNNLSIRILYLVDGVAVLLWARIGRTDSHIDRCLARHGGQSMSSA